MQTSPDHIKNWLRSKLPPEQKEASWGYLAEQFPWYPIIHLLRASCHKDDVELLQKAALYQNNLLRLHSWLHVKEELSTVTGPQTIAEAETEFISEETITAPKHSLAEEPQMVSGKAKTEEKTAQPEIQTGEPQAGPVPSDAADTEPQPGPALEDLIPITPYYTVDYFASQGIKIDKRFLLEPETKLDQQVKSFTDWLKTMKKLKFQPQTTYSDPLVEANAKASLNKKEILTEAMAEVWAKQGNLQMAGQVYAKLMLLHPEKTPYFAARLQELKQIQ